MSVVVLLIGIFGSCFGSFGRILVIIDSNFGLLAIESVFGSFFASAAFGCRW
jgi:hypothetical protein